MLKYNTQKYSGIRNWFPGNKYRTSITFMHTQYDKKYSPITHSSSFVIPCKFTYYFINGEALLIEKHVYLSQCILFYFIWVLCNSCAVVEF